MATISSDQLSSVCRSAPGSPAADDITQLILNDHETFRREFARLDDLRAANAGEAELARVWKPLADLLDVHAEAEEEIFYPSLLHTDAEEAREETLDAIGDHNDIRDGVEAAKAHPVGSDGWWDAVHQARDANDEHMAEEEGEGLVDFRLNASTEVRRALGRRFRAFETDHAGTVGVEISNKDPEQYVKAVGARADASSPHSSPHSAARADSSLGIGSLKGR
jgi:hemerythrin superfamily protein